MHMSAIRPTENFYKTYNKNADEERIKLRKMINIGDCNEKEDINEKYNKAI